MTENADPARNFYIGSEIDDMGLSMPEFRVLFNMRRRLRLQPPASPTVMGSPIGFCYGVRPARRRGWRCGEGACSSTRQHFPPCRSSIPSLRRGPRL